MARSQYLASLSPEQRTQLEQKLLTRQSGKCFICDDPIDLVLHKGQLDVDHIDPLAEQGADAENNFAITHFSCNRSKGLLTLQLHADWQSLNGYKKKQSRKDEGAPILAIFYNAMADQNLHFGSFSRRVYLLPIRR